MSHASADDGISSVVTSSIENQNNMMKNYNKYSQGKIVNPVRRLADFSKNNSMNKLSVFKESSFDKRQCIIRIFNAF